MNIYSSIVDSAKVEWERRDKARKYINDPVAWAEDYLGLQLWSKQKEILYSIRDNHNTAVAAGHGVGKDLPLDTPLPTPGGWTTMGEVQVGDYLIDESGRPTRVLTKSEVFNHDQYLIKFSDGSEVTASGTHLWNVIPFDVAKRLRRNGEHSGDWRDYWDHSQTMTTLEMIERGVKRKNGSSLASNFIIPTARPFDLPEADLPIDPYIIGAWLGDGTSTAAAMTVGDDGRYIIEEFRKKGYELRKNTHQYSYSFARQGFLEKARELGVLGKGKKNIPDIYLRSSIAQRRELLRGIMDTDGFSIGGGRAGVDFANKILAEGVAELVRTLGIKVNVRENDMYLGSEVIGLRYRLAFTPDFNPFTSGSYKADRWSPGSSLRNTARYITSIEKVESVPSQCVSVDSPRSLYLATRNMVVTHNTFVMGIGACWWVDVHPEDETFVASTAPSADQVNLLWDNIRNIHALSRQRFEDGLVDHPLPGNITGDNKWKRANGSLLGQGRKPPDNKADVAFQGRHATYLLAIGDEAVGIPGGFLNALNNIATADDNRQVLLANPTDPSSEMAKIWSEKRKSWVRMHISVYDSPAVRNEPGFDISKARAISGRGYIEEAREMYDCKCSGDDHKKETCDPRFLARVCGEWSFDAGNTVFSEVDLAQGRNCVVLPDPLESPEFGVDVARSEKGDWTRVYMMERGKVWRTDENGKPTEETDVDGYRVRYVDGWRGAPITGTNPENLGSAQRVHNLAMGQGVTFVKIDAAGIGGALVDGIEEIFRTQHQRFMYALGEVWGGERALDKRAYLNKRAEQYFRLKRLMGRGRVDIDPDDTELQDELRGIVYENAKDGQIKMMSKDDMRRKGKKSPDRADAVWYAMWDPYEDNPMADKNKGDIVALDEDMYLENEIGAGIPW